MFKKLFAVIFIFTFSACSWTERSRSERRPASLLKTCDQLIDSFFLSSGYDQKSIRKMLHETQPHLSTESVGRKIEAASTRFGFFRANVSYHYRLHRELLGQMRTSDRLKPYSGRILGDAHPLNIDIVPNYRAGKGGFLTMNDPDDGAVGEYSLDILRYLSSLNVLDRFSFNSGQMKTIIEDGMKRYVDGLMGEVENYSKYTKQLLEKADSTSMNDYESWLEKKVKGFRFKERKSSGETYSLTPDDKESLEVTLRGLYGEQAVLHDSYVYKKSGGGSGELPRFEVLATLNLDNRGESLYWIEFKEITPTSAVYEYNTFDDGAARILDSLNLTHGKDYSLVEPVVEIGDRSFYQRLRWENFAEYNFDKIDDKSDAIDVILDQLYVIGTLHRRSFLGEGREEQLSQFVEEVSSISSDDWLFDSALLSSAMERSFKSL